MRGGSLLTTPCKKMTQPNTLTKFLCKKWASYYEWDPQLSQIEELMEKEEIYLYDWEKRAYYKFSLFDGEVEVYLMNYASHDFCEVYLNKKEKTYSILYINMEFENTGFPTLDSKLKGLRKELIDSVR